MKIFQKLKDFFKPSPTPLDGVLIEGDSGQGMSAAVVNGRSKGMTFEYTPQVAEDFLKSVKEGNCFYGKTNDPEQLEKFKKMFENYDKSSEGGNSKLT
ncbi:MAG: hypothetical protein ABJH98_18000 [Reichenbachiella sp.]|uniref:hypothetical protein n=1 Tax=Reichenbachiella sp. TaxID=2184521 RepID=UPI0032993EB4